MRPVCINGGSPLFRGNLAFGRRDWYTSVFGTAVWKAGEINHEINQQGINWVSWLNANWPLGSLF
jgi:type IV secretory pathway TrbD component